MPQWKVTLVGDSSDLSFLYDLFKCGDYRITDGKMGYMLCAKSFELLEDSSQVRELAQEIILTLNGLARARDLSQQPVSIGHVIKIDQQGREHVYVMPQSDTLRMRDFAAAVVIRADGQVQQDTGDEHSQALACLAASHSAVAQVLKHLGSEHNWFNLSYIYEIILREAGGQKSQITKKRLGE